MNVLIADKLSAEVLGALESLGLGVTYAPDLTAEALAEHLEGVHVLVVRSTRVTAQTLERAPALSLVVRAGAGVNTIDVAVAAARGVYVANCPGRNKDAVAELAIGLLIACDRRIAAADADLKAGRWRKKEYGKAHGLKGRTLGILGMGDIGKAVARRAQGLEMNVVAWSRSLTPASAAALGVTAMPSALDVAAVSDAVSLHVAANAQTRHLVNGAFLAAMRQGAILINTSRGDVLDTQALLAALDERQLKVGLDVFEGEPAGGEAEFTQHELAARVTATPHIAASTSQASEAVAAEVVAIIAAFVNTGKPTNVVNATTRTPASHSLVVRHLNRVGVLAGVLEQLRRADINVAEMENTIFDGGLAACCTLQLSQAPGSETLDRVRQVSSVLQVTLEPRR